MRHHPINETQFAVLDIETTGFGPTHEIVEIAVVHLSPNLEPKLAFDSLVKPQRRVGNRQVHGISNRDIRNAPTLETLLDSLQDALANRMIVTFNATFDISFLRASEPAVLPTDVPYMCAMRLHQWVTGQKRSLDEAVVFRGVESSITHRASDDAIAAAKLLAADLRQLAAEGVDHLEQLAQSAQVNSLISFDGEPLTKSANLDKLRESSSLQYPREAASVKSIRRRRRDENESR